MNIPITFDAEHQSALDAMRAEFNQSSAQNLTETQYLAEVIRGAVAGKAKALYDQEVADFGAAFQSKPWSERQAIIAQLNAQK